MRLGNIIAEAEQILFRVQGTWLVFFFPLALQTSLVKIQLISLAGFSLPFLLDDGFYSGQPC